MAWSTPKEWSGDELLTASDLNQYVSDNLSALYALVQGGGRKNLLHNGAMQIHQRDVSRTSLTTSGYYTADRWWVGISGVGTWTQSVDADAPTGSGFRNSLKMLITAGSEATVAAGDFVRIAQRIEGQSLQSVKKGTSSAEPLTVSFWVKSNKTGTYVVELYDVDNTRHVSATYTVEASNTWEEQSVTFPADTTGALDNDANRSLDLVFWLAAGTDWTGGTLDTTWAAVTSEGASPGTTADNNRASGQVNVAAATNNYWMLTGVQLQTGSASTEFLFQGFDQDLAQCQRYYCKSYNHDDPPPNTDHDTVTSVGAIRWTGTIYGHVPFPVTMRSTPSDLVAYPPTGGGVDRMYQYDPPDSDPSYTLWFEGESGFAYKAGSSSGTHGAFHYSATADL